ncbi:MAG: YunC family protein [Thermoplasmata archaeon]
MIEIKNITIEGKVYQGIKVDMDPAPLVMIKGEKGFLMCGYLNMEAADKLGAKAVSTSGIKTFDDLLNKEVSKISQKAREAGIREGMKGSEALKML